MTAIDTESFRPTVKDVARLLNARTVEAGGLEVGTFNDSTRPTADQVEDLIDVALGEIVMSLDVDALADDQLPQARFIAAVRTAALVEGSFFPESSEGAGSWRSTLQAMYLSGLASFAVGVKIF